MSDWIRISRTAIRLAILAIVFPASQRIANCQAAPNDPGAAERQLLFGAGPVYGPPPGPNNGPSGNWGTIIGKYRDVPAYSNGVDTGSWSNLEPYGQDGYQYQCVEYCRRFYRVAMGLNTSQWYGNAIDWFGSGASRGLEVHANDGTTKPQADDILCFSDSTDGHVAIVTAVVGNVIYVMQQNVSSSTGVGTLSILGTGKVANYGNLVVQGWLRQPGHIPAPPALAPGDCALVGNTGGSLNIRDAANGNLVSSMPDGTLVHILEGPKLANGIWWYRHDKGGWSAYGVGADIYLARTTCPYTIDDVLRALRSAAGISTLDAAGKARLDVVTGTPACIDLLDACRLARKAAGRDVNP